MGLTCSNVYLKRNEEKNIPFITKKCFVSFHWLKSDRKYSSIESVHYDRERSNAIDTISLRLMDIAVYKGVNLTIMKLNNAIIFQATNIWYSIGSNGIIFMCVCVWKYFCIVGHRNKCQGCMFEKWWILFWSKCKKLTRLPSIDLS